MKKIVKPVIVTTAPAARVKNSGNFPILTQLERGLSRIKVTLNDGSVKFGVYSHHYSSVLFVTVDGNSQVLPFRGVKKIEFLCNLIKT